VWKVGGLRALTEGLDKRGKRIQAELDEAKRLREEAAQVLADYKKRRGEAEREAEEIISAAKEEAHRTAGEAHQRMEDFVKRRTAAAETKIAQAEAEATAQVRAAAADAAIQVSETILRERMAGEAAQELISRSLADVRTKLNS
jgi:F-type H+-transporting ATPase subunit b